MKTLIVSNMFPTDKKPLWGMFVKEQVDSLRDCSHDEMEVDVYLIDGSSSKFAYLRALFCLPKIVDSGRYDVVHVHYGLTLLAVLFVRIPMVVTFHGSDLLKWPVKYVSKRLAYIANKVIVVSRNLYDELGYGVIIPCGIDTSKFILPDNYLPEEKRGTEIRILFPANPSVKVKNYNLFCEVCEELKKQGKNITEIHLKNVPRENVPSVYWGCDVMLLTSHSEGSPTVVKEAIAAKLPFVSVDVGDVREWAKMVDFGVVEDSRDPKILADRIVDLVGRNDERSKLNNDNALTAMDIVAVSRRIKSLYADIIGK